VKKAALIGIVFLLVLVGAIAYSTMTLAQHRVEVCMEFNGMTSCRTVSGPDKKDTLRTAVSNACATIASGVTDSIACSQTEPKSVNWLK
jgi:hypothetical protein